MPAPGAFLHAAAPTILQLLRCKHVNTVRVKVDYQGLGAAPRPPANFPQPDGAMMPSMMPSSFACSGERKFSLSHSSSTRSTDSPVDSAKN